jgi:hypothetical protein
MHEFQQSAGTSKTLQNERFRYTRSQVTFYLPKNSGKGKITKIKNDQLFCFLKITVEVRIDNSLARD